MWLPGLILGLLVGWLFLPTPASVCGMYNNDAMPAWVQAVGSVIAILVAAGIPWWQDRIKRREAEKQLSIATLRLRSNLQVFGKAALDRAVYFRTFDLDNATPATVDRLLQSTFLHESGNVINHINNVHHFAAKIQDPILEMLEEYDQYTAEHGRIYDSNEKSKGEQLANSNSAIILRLERICQLAFKASNAIRLVEEEAKYPDLKARNAGGRP